MTDRPTSCLLCHLPAVDYAEALDLQRRIVAARNDGRLSTDVVLMLEHPPVFTLGRRGGLENLTVSREFVEARGIPVVPIERGGNITYHGPGQLVIYPIVHLGAHSLSVTDFVGRLEAVMLRIAADWSIPAGRDERNRGVWVGDNKLGSIGINIRHGVTFHGLALNVNLDLTPFGWIHPCGLSGVGVTSMARETGSAIDMAELRASADRHFETVFDLALEPVERRALETRIGGSGAAGMRSAS